MIMLLLGILDILIAVMAGFMAWGISYKVLAIIAGVYLLGKGLVFIKSLASIIDLIAGFAIISSLFFTVPPILLWISAILLIQKGIFSFL